MTASQQRNRAIQLAPTNPAEALSTARAIADPWFACQALAWVARFAPNDEFTRIVRESFRIAHDATDPYQVVAVCAWPLRALVERAHLNSIPAVLSELLDTSQTIEPPASRSEALFLLFQAVFPAGRASWLPVFNALLSASKPVTHWRQRRNVHDAMMIVWSEDEQMVTDIVSRLDDSKVQKQITKSIGAATRRSPRPFFWTNAA